MENRTHLIEICKGFVLVTNPDGTLFRICHFNHLSENVHKFTSCNKYGVVCSFGFIGDLNEESFSRCFYDAEMRELVKAFYLEDAGSEHIKFVKKTISDGIVGIVRSSEGSLDVYSYPNNSPLDSIFEDTLDNYISKMEFILSAVYGYKMWNIADYA